MFIRQLTRLSFSQLLLILPAALFIASCSGEEQQYMSTVNVEVQGSGCLSTSLKKFDGYFLGQLKNTEVAAFWGCLDTTLTSVKRYMIGDGPSGAFKKISLGKFVSKHFLKSDEPDGIVLTPALLNQVMVIKTLFLGGDTNLLTPEEIDRIFEVFQDLNDITVGLNPHMDVLFNSSRDVQPTEDEKVEAVEALQRAVIGIGDMLAKRQMAYRVSDFEVFIRELNTAIGGEPGTLEWLKYLPSFQKIKNIFMTTSPSEIEYNEWAGLTKIIANGFGIYYRSKYFLADTSLLSLQTVSEIPKVLNNVYNILGEAMDRRENKIFATSEFQALMQELYDSELLAEFMPMDKLMHTWTIFADKVLIPRGQEDENPSGMGFQELNYAQTNWTFWEESQKHLLGVSGSSNNIDNLLKFIDLPWAFKLDLKQRLIFSKPEPGPSDLDVLTEINMYRIAFNLLVDAYSGENQALDIDQLKQATEDLKPLLVQIGLVAEDDDGFHDTLFLYSNLFLPFSNGDKYIDAREITYFVFYVLSAETASNIFDEKMLAQCEKNIEDNTYDVECFRSLFQYEFADSFEHLPNMVNYVRGFTKDKHWRNFIKDFEIAVRENGYSEDPIQKVKIGEIFMLMQFIETTMMVFDQDWNGFLDLEEGLAALEQRFAYQVSIILDPEDPMSAEDVEVLFTFLLRYGEAPSPSNPLSLLRFLWWKWNKDDWALEANRGTIVKILSSLNSI